MASRATWRGLVFRAGVDGSVMGLTVFTVGGVIAPGQVIMHLVPDHRPLVVEARVHPNDIDVVRAGGIDAWLATHGDLARRALDMASAVADTGTMTLSRLTVVASRLADLAPG